MTRWAIAALAYLVGYVVAVGLSSGVHEARLWIGNIGLLLPPLVPIVVCFRRRHEWSGRVAVFWTSVAAGCALWFIGHAAWTALEVFDNRVLPWVQWPVAAKLCGGMLPTMALLTWPHASIRGASAVGAALDVAGTALVSFFLCWSLVLAPGLVPSAEPIAVHTLAILGTFLHAVIVGSFLYASRKAADDRWRLVYRDCAWGAALGVVLLVPNMIAMLRGGYVTGSVGDIGWIVPFWYYARAAAHAPAAQDDARSPMEEWSGPSQSGAVLLGALAVAPLIGYVPRYLLPLGQPIDHYRDLATSVTLAVCCGLAIVRIAVEQRGRRRADYRFWLLATACEQTAELIVVMRSTSIEYANQAFRQAFGYSYDELRVLSPVSLLDKQSAGAASEIAETLRRGEIAHARISLRRRNGTTFPASCTVAPMMSASGRNRYFVSVVRDLTEENRLRDRLVQEERMAAIGELVSNVAHEINNPLQAVLGGTELLLRHGSHVDVGVELRQIRRGAERAAHVVRKLLTFSQGTPPRRDLVDLADVVRDTLAEQSDGLARARIVVAQYHGSQLPPVSANREGLSQVVQAIIQNAHEAMAAAHGGGTLIVRTYGSLSGNEAVLEVMDDGPGVPAAVARRMFEPFFTTKKRPVETGLGLSLAFGIVTSHGGTLELVPTERGACFRLTLPGAGGIMRDNESTVH
jgi:PAS domain S-box-containing protein